MTSLEQVGEELVGQARCPFESGQSNVGLFAGESSSNARLGLLTLFHPCKINPAALSRWHHLSEILSLQISDDSPESLDLE